MSTRDNNQMIELMADVRDRLIRIETKMEVLPALQEDVKIQGVEITKMKTTMKTTKWIAGFLLISIPASAAALLRIFKG